MEQLSARSLCCIYPRSIYLFSCTAAAIEICNHESAVTNGMGPFTASRSLTNKGQATAQRDPSRMRTCGRGWLGCQQRICSGEVSVSF